MSRDSAWLRQIDALAAQEVMGWHRESMEMYGNQVAWWRDRGGRQRMGADEWAPSSTWLHAARLLEDPESQWVVRRHLSSRAGCDYILYKFYTTGVCWVAYMTPSGMVEGPQAETMPLAITLAALQACGVALPPGVYESEDE